LQRTIYARAWDYSLAKNQGIAWQKAAFAQSDILPLFGSSELNHPHEGEGWLFFRDHPRGFVVSAAGRAGCTSLNLLQKIVAAGQEAPGHKVAVCISPSWFFQGEAHHRWYAGNFSAPQASALMFSPRLSLRLKRDIARRMLAYPDTVENSPFLALALHRLRRGSRSDLLLYRIMMPLGWMSNTITEAWDALEFARGPSTPAPPPQSAAFDWPQFLAEASRRVRTSPDDHLDPHQPPFTDSASFDRIMARAREWDDLDLLLRACEELKLEPLLLAMPMDYRYLQGLGISRESLDAYPRHLRQLATCHGATLAEFPGQQDNPYFFADHHDHPSTLGWSYMDQALDEFFHAPHVSQDAEWP
jgi:D-alanine transfer protein